jgi:ankyrin repeat protein
MSKTEIAHYFLSSGFDPNVVLSGDWTPLHLATFLGSAAFVEMLIFFRAKVDAADKFGVTPIHLAIQDGDVEIAKCLLRGGANIKDSPTVLNLAVCHGRADIVTLLMEHGADPELRDRTGKNSFELLQRPEQKEIEEILRTVKEVKRPSSQIPLQGLPPGVLTLGDLLETMQPPPPPRVVRSYPVTRL